MVSGSGETPAKGQKPLQNIAELTKRRPPCPPVEPGHLCLVRTVLGEFEAAVLSARERHNLPWRRLISLVNANGSEAANLATPTCGQLSMRYTALHYAAFFGKEKYAALLLGRGACVDSRSALNATPLFICATFAQRSVDTARVLLQHGADVNAALHDGTTPLLHAVSLGNVDMAGLLLESGADPGATRRIPRPGHSVHSTDCPCERRSALFTAVWLGNKRMAAKLVELGVSVANDTSSISLQRMLHSRGAASYSCWASIHPGLESASVTDVPRPQHP